LRRGRTDADATLPTWFLPPAGWPLPVRGWRTLWREVGATDVVVVNGTRHALPPLAAFAARFRGKEVLFVLHGSGAPFTGSWLYHGLLGSLFEWALTRPAVRISRPVSVSRAGVDGARNRYGVKATHVPFPLRELPPAERARRLDGASPLRIAWVGRLYPEKDPVQAVVAVDRVRRVRAATLELYGEGILATELEELARSRPWLSIHGPRSWEAIQEIQGRAHVCLSTSRREGAQLAVLEPLSRGVPVVCTRVGDAPLYYLHPALARFCVPSAHPDGTATAILELASSYERYSAAFSENANLLRASHRDGVEKFVSLIEAAATPRRLASGWSPAPARLRGRGR